MTSKWRKEWRYWFGWVGGTEWCGSPAPFNADQWRVARDSTKSYPFGFHRHSVEVYRGQVTAGNAERICRALNGEAEPEPPCRSFHVTDRVVCERCGNGLGHYSWKFVDGTHRIPPCPTCCAKPLDLGNGVVITWDAGERRTGNDRRKPKKRDHITDAVVNAKQTRRRK